MHPTETKLRYGGIEAGGTKFICAVGSGPDDVSALEQIPTTTPDETFQRVIEFFRGHAGPLGGIGIGSFGPVDPRPESPTYGHITSTPKPGWAHIDFAGTIARALETPVVFDTDVNAAAVGEHLWGAARGVDTFIYMTVGTGIGGGGLIRGRRMGGMIHPEMGHLTLPRAEGDHFSGICPFHGDCLEGMVSGPALEARCGAPAETLAADHPVWDFAVHYLAHALANYIYVLSPQRIVLGGGVAQQAHLFPRIRARVQEILNGYVVAPEVLDAIDRYIVPPGLGNRAGVLGALAMAREGDRAGFSPRD